MGVSRKRRLDWPVIGWLSSVHLIALGTLLYNFVVEAFAWETYLLTVVLFLVYHISISDGMHLFCAHRGYKASPGMQLYFLVTSAGVVQGSTERWAAIHMQHHEYVDTQWDPHSPKLRGFKYAQLQWMLYRDVPAPPGVRARFRTILRRRCLFLEWQRKNYLWLAAVMGFALPALMASLWGDLLEGFLVGGFVRLMFQYHSTWSVNSVTHTFGERPYEESSATNGYTFGKSFDPVRWLLALLSILLAILTVGESFNHATHHKYPWALHERWSLSKWFAIFCQRLGLIQGIKFAPKISE